MATCKQCNSVLEPKLTGRPPAYCGSRCKDRWRYENSESRRVTLEKSKVRRRESGYHKDYYKADHEYQKARALKYYYENRDRILEQKRNHPGKAEAVEGALLLIRSGRATIDDAYDFMEAHLGFHSFEVECFIVDMIEDE